MFPAFRKHRFLKVLAVVLTVGALAYALEAIIPFVKARGQAFEDCCVYYISGSDFIRITDTSHGVYSVGETREVFSFKYSLGSYACFSEYGNWDMRLVDASDLIDLRSNQWFWGSEI